jgi:hypothetical protein
MVKPLWFELANDKKYKFEFPEVKGSELATARNLLLTNGRNSVAKYDAFLIFDSDQYTPASTIYKMIEHNKGVVTAPYQTHANNDEYHCGELNDIGNIKFRYTSKEKGFKSIGYSSEGCMLIRRYVLEDIFKKFKTLAFFGSDYYIDENGIEKMRSLDFRISRLIRESGHKIWCDFDLMVAHKKRK